MFTFCSRKKSEGKRGLEGKKRGKTRMQGSAVQARGRNLVPRAFPFLIGSNEVAGNDEILFRLVPMPVPGHGAQIGSRAPTRTATKSEQGLGPL